MCGIAGYSLNSLQKPSEALRQKWMSSIKARGPDDQGYAYFDRAHQTCFSQEDRPCDLALFHSRYAIFDLSPKGHQPFVSQNGKVMAIFNGEIYNFWELKQELSAQGIIFQTSCDTEVLVEGYAFWKDELWNKLNGFWAVVLVDFQNQHLVFSRDRMGVAPLYYRQTSEGLYFSSFIEPLIDIQGQKAPLDEDVMLGFIQTGYKDLNNSTYYQEIKSFPAASFANLPFGQNQILPTYLKKFWTIHTDRMKESDVSFDSAAKQLQGLIFDAVNLRLRADVNVAFELSGGLDSSSIVAAAATLKNSKITTYTAKIQGADEEPYAKTMLRKYSLDYRVLSNIEGAFSQDYQSFSQIMEEPYDNPNDYTHHQMLKMMKAQGTKVVVTGAGGDEVLAGYESSFWPKAYREWSSQGLLSWLKADEYEFTRRYRTWPEAKHTLGHFAKLPFGKTSAQSSQGLASMTHALKQAQEYRSMAFDEQRRFHFDQALLPYYMRSSDHFAMTIPIEQRFPLLDYRIVEFGLKMPISFLFHKGFTKYILRKAMQDYLPSEITFRRRKMGFQFPYRLFFSEYQSQFELVLDELYKSRPLWKNFGSYENLLKIDPLLLWRLLSTAIWLQGQNV